MNIFMDDMRPAEYGFVLARTVDEALKLVRENEVEILSLDYNMGIRKKNGLDFVNEFCQEGLFAKKIIIHSNDIFGVKKMIEKLQAAQEREQISKEIIIKRASSYWI